MRQMSWALSQKNTRVLLLLLVVTFLSGCTARKVEAVDTDSVEAVVPIVTMATLPEGYTPTVLITGANRGLGLEFTRQYAEMGWNIIATARKPDKAEALQALAKQYPGIAIEALDVNDLERVDELSAQYKDQPIDILLNNAGLSGSPSPDQLFRRLDYSLFDAYMHTNARGPLKICEAFLSQVRAGQMKRMVAVSSLGGSFAARNSMAPATTFYRASKSALNMLMVNVADATKKYGITVIMLNPGLVDTQGVLTDMNEKMNMGLNLTLITDSIAGMINVIDETGIENTGTIYQWTGESLEF
ncbi:MAG: SDR family oxidoreductase [Gammaproteobacteria bacterium]|nr:SDR family oxidoreductase [Gammaproteobacteria bacterium]MCP4089489.1 SDR family oxidoreductase [Gammaproteobacteria bacterium]MCP4832892.1 SDR family oxidoreductase [Gammaproteobacteria bacterium]MCP4930017.1 SDR family oxidoreductase [Gammaproteobacteria bacterium]